MFQPDGLGANADRHSHAARRRWPETEFRAMASDAISIHAARVPMGAYKAGGTMDRTITDEPVRAFAEPPLIDDAAELLASAPLHGIVYGFTSSSMCEVLPMTQHSSRG